MLSLTCTKESNVARTCKRAFDWLFCCFWYAAGQGHLEICKWIYDVTRGWNYDDDGDYTQLLFYDDALFSEHFHVAEWALQTGLPIRDSCARHLMINNRLLGLKWLAAHGLSVPTYLDDSATSMPMIRWLVEERGLCPDADAIRDSFRCLPHTKERLVYYLSLTGGILLPDDIMVSALGAGRWDCIDFMRDALPDYFERTKRQWPFFDAIYQRRPDVPWRHYVDLHTGNVCVDDDDSE